jgi:hypothetical protein
MVFVRDKQAVGYCLLPVTHDVVVGILAAGSVTSLALHAVCKMETVPALPVLLLPSGGMAT